MIKIFLILFVLNIKILFANQVLLVLANEFNSTTGKLYCFEDGKKIFSDISVNLGRNGLGWSEDDKYFSHGINEPVKREGDGKSPAGIFNLISAFGYDEQNFLFPYTKSSSQLICVDDVNSTLYNSIVILPFIRPNSFEYMKRDDMQYKLGVIVAYNPRQKKGNGSCIFLHVEKEPLHPTAGCTSMKYNDIKNILEWLNSSKSPIMIQVQKKYFTPEIARHYNIPYFDSN